VPLAPELVAAYARDPLHGFGSAVEVTTPADRRQHEAVLRRVREALDDTRSRPGDPSLGELVAALMEESRRGWPDATHTRRQLAELGAVFQETSFRRTKRAERGRLHAELLVLFDLEQALGIARDPENDAEQHLRRVRRKLRERA
jgi:hypothetical protein